MYAVQPVLRALEGLAAGLAGAYVASPAGWQGCKRFNPYNLWWSLLLREGLYSGSG